MSEPKRRGRPPGSKNKSKAETASTPAAAGHNAQKDEDHRRALFFHHLAKARRAAEEMAEAKKDFEAILKEAMEDGIPKAEMKWALKAEKQNQEKALARARRELEIARWLSLPIGTQLSLLDEDRTPAVDRAYEEGKTSGLSGKTCISPYSPDTEQSQKWIEGWHAGQSALREAFLKKNGAEITPAPEEPSTDPEMDDAVAAAAPEPIDEPEMADEPEDLGPIEAEPVADTRAPAGAMPTEDDEDDIPEFLRR